MEAACAVACLHAHAPPLRGAIDGADDLRPPYGDAVERCPVAANPCGVEAVAVCLLHYGDDNGGAVTAYDHGVMSHHGVPCDRQALRDVAHDNAVLCRGKAGDDGVAQGVGHGDGVCLPAVREQPREQGAEDDAPEKACQSILHIVNAG